MGRKSALAVCLVACGIVASVAKADPLEGTWQGTYKCGQDRFDVNGGPFEWSLPFTIKDGKITATRDYIALSSQPAAAEFNGIIQADGLVEIGVVGGVIGKPRPAFHGSYSSRVNGDRIDFQGPLLGRRNLVLRQCELHLSRADSKS
jgi:opacity protein-like surface antigen